MLQALGVETFTVAGKTVVVRQVASMLSEPLYGSRIGYLLMMQLARIIGLRTAERELSRLVPIVGGAIGAGINFATLTAVGGRASDYYRSLLRETEAKAPETATEAVQP